MNWAVNSVTWRKCDNARGVFSKMRGCVYQLQQKGTTHKLAKSRL